MGRSDLLPLNEAQLNKGHPALNISENVERDEEDGEEGDVGNSSNQDGSEAIKWQEPSISGNGKHEQTDKRSGKGGHQSNKRKADEHKKKSTKKDKKERREPVWLRPGITVRIVSKSLGEKCASSDGHLRCPEIDHLWCLRTI